MAQNVQIVVPKFVFYKESHNRAHRTQEFPCIRNGVDGQISNDICLLVVFSYLVSGGRKER